MPGLSKAPSRNLLHSRSINIACFEREDGLMDVEGHLVDLKPFDLKLSEGRTKIAGEPIHDMWLRLTFGEDMEIVTAEAVMDVPAHNSCLGAVQNYEALVGVRIGPGWLRAARERIKATAGCTHISEMLQEIGTTAMQGMFGRSNRARARGKEDKRISHSVINTCFGWRRGGELLRISERSDD